MKVWNISERDASIGIQAALLITTLQQGKSVKEEKDTTKFRFQEDVWRKEGGSAYKPAVRQCLVHFEVSSSCRRLPRTPRLELLWADERQQRVNNVA